MSTDINRIAELAKEDPKRQFYSIAHPTGFDPGAGSTKRWKKWEGCYAPGPWDGF
jgi:hypothetical protein